MERGGDAFGRPALSVELKKRGNTNQHELPLIKRMEGMSLLVVISAD